MILSSMQRLADLLQAARPHSARSDPGAGVSRRARNACVPSARERAPRARSPSRTRYSYFSGTRTSTLLYSTSMYEWQLPTPKPTSTQWRTGSTVSCVANETSGARRGRRGSLAPSDVERGHRSIVLELAHQCIRLHLLHAALSPRRRPHIAALLGAERDPDAYAFSHSRAPPRPSPPLPTRTAATPKTLALALSRILKL